MKKTKALIGILCMASFISFSSCEKDDDTEDDDTTEESSARVGDDEGLGQGERPHSKKGRAEFMAKLSDEEKAIVEANKSVLEGIKEKKKAHFSSLDSDTQEKLKSHALTKEEHEAILGEFEATLSAEEFEALAYMKVLKEKYKPEGAPKHKRQ